MFWTFSIQTCFNLDFFPLKHFQAKLIVLAILWAIKIIFNSSHQKHLRLLLRPVESRCKKYQSCSKINLKKFHISIFALKTWCKHKRSIIRCHKQKDTILLWLYSKVFSRNYFTHPTNRLNISETNLSTTLQRLIGKLFFRKATI